MLFTIEERMDFDLLNSINIMQLWSQIRDEVINRKHESMISVDDLEKVMSLSIDYVYHSPLEETLNNLFEYDHDGRMTFSEIMKNLRDFGVYESNNNKVGGLLKSLAPEGQNIKIKESGIRYYKLKWRYRQDTRDLPF